MCSKPQSSQVAERGSEQESGASPASLSPVPALTPAQPAEQTPGHAVGSKCGAAGTVPESRLGILRGPCQQLGVWPARGRCPQLSPDAPARGALSPAPTFVSDALRTQVLWVPHTPACPTRTAARPPCAQTYVSAQAVLLLGLPLLGFQAVVCRAPVLLAGPEAFRGRH